MRPNKSQVILFTSEVRIISRMLQKIILLIKIIYKKYICKYNIILNIIVINILIDNIN